MHEDLLGYLLNALDADEQQRIEELLAQDASLRRELQRLRRCLGPLESVREEHHPPTDLAERTCDHILQHEQVHRPQVRSRVAVEFPDTAPTASRFSPVEGLVLTLVCLVAFTLFLPALVNSRHEARKSYCAKNLSQLGTSLISYSKHQGDRSFPFVPISGNRAFAGVFVPTLIDCKLLPNDRSLLICPGAVAPEHGASWDIPTLEEIDQASGAHLLELQNRASGSYAASVGYFENGRYRAVRNQGRSHFALLADTPSCHLPGRVTANHGGLGQNICYEDGHVVFVTSRQQVWGDDPLRNRLGYAEVGIDRDDAAVLRSGMSPMVNTGMPSNYDSLPAFSGPLY
jgi:hypothetical protein